MLTIGVAAVLLPLAGAGGQLLERPWLGWETVSVGRFDVHFSPELSAWARFVAARMEAVDSAVTRAVGYSPRGRVDIVIEDPYDIGNGFAFTLVERPVMLFWASPPDPRQSIGEFRSWGEMLAAHEFAHVAHLTRPSRNPLTRLFWRLAPLDLGPIALRAPRWVLEGYATYIEGVVTGTGRPHGFWRPAMLRQWAIEGRLPTYAQLSSWSDFEGGDFAYLAGSAFLEWLARRDGDSSLVAVWRRLSARVNRSFDEAFTGVFGDNPRDLYGRFTADVTAQAVDVERETEKVGIVAGEMVQHVAWRTGDPALSSDGSRVALVLRSNQRPSRVVVWRTAAEPDTLQARARARILRRDPEDVPARQVYPPPKRPLATLLARNGRGFEDPRWMPDGKSLLLWRATPRSDGSQRPELYLWTVGARSARLVTRGAGVRQADPAPNGRGAVALRCARGHCDVVFVDLATGSVRPVADGDERTSFARPRLSPDGRTIAVAMQREDRWRIALVDTAGGAVRVVGPDDGANRFDPAWIDASSLVVVSDRAGTANLERIDLHESAGAVAQSLTRVTGAAVAPEPSRARNDSSIWFLSLHSHGYDVMKLAAPRVVGEAAPSILLDVRFSPVALRRPARVQGFRAREVPAAHRYGTGPRTTRWLPAGSIGADGRAMGLALVNSDVVGRLTLLAQGVAGNGSAWRGGAIEGVWRGMRPELRASVWTVATDGFPTPNGAASDDAVRFHGASGRIDYLRAFDVGSMRIAGGLSRAWLRWPQVQGVSELTSTRSLAFADLSGAARRTGDALAVSAILRAHVSAGRADDGPSFGRGIVSIGVRTSSVNAPPIDLAATYGRVSARASAFERFLIGGLPATLVDPSVVAQRIAMPALPAATATGDRVLALRAASALGPFAPFYWTGSARDGGGRFDRWHRVIGLELIVDQSVLPVLGTPSARLTAGVARSIDAPFARQTRAYATVVLGP